MASRQRIITLLTDFGERDGYVAAMKGVILGIAPRARLVDISHAPEPYAVRSAAYLLASVCEAFPRGTIHVAVVDPGVGTARGAIAIEAGGHLLIGPDNGVLSWAAERLGRPVARDIANRAWLHRPISNTFHGRDVFAPVAARLAAGEPIARIGPRRRTFLRLGSQAAWRAGRLVGSVAHVDRFGNVITTLREAELERHFGAQWREGVRCRIGRHRLRIGRTYADADTGSLLALIGSAGHLEIAANGASAARRLGMRPGRPISVEPVRALDRAAFRNR